jgi:hypothetical protein
MTSSIQGVSSTFNLGQMQGPQSLTEDQKSTVQSILSQYDPDSVSAEDAKSIFKSLRKAGIQLSPDLRDAITSAGFDADALRDKAGIQGPRPGGPPPGGGQGGPGGGAAGIDTSKLQSLQSILSQYDLTSLSDDEQDDLFTRLSSAGLVQSGNVIDLSA